MRRSLHTLETAFNLTFALALIAVLIWFLAIAPMTGVSDLQNIWLCVCLACGGMLMMAVYNSALRMFTRREKAAQYFSVFCVGQSIRFFFMPGSFGESLFPNLPEAVKLFPLRYIPYCVAVVAMVFFVYEIYGEGRSKRVKHALCVALVVVNLFISSMGLDRTVWRTILVLPVAAAYLGICMSVIVGSPEFRRNRLSILYLCGFILYCVSIVFTATAIHSAPYIAVLFNFIFAVIHCILLSDRYAKALIAVERANEALEGKVLERTDALRTAYDTLAETNQNIRQVVEAISHDLKTPIAILGVNLEMMTEDERLSNDSKRHLDVAFQKHRDLSRLLVNLLNAARMEEGVRYRMDWFSLEGLLLEAQSKYEADAEQAGVLLAVSLQRECLVWADGERLWSVLDNLVSNALRYTPRGGTISITADEAQDGAVRIAVKDTGPGIAPEHLPRIFDQYYKADQSRGGDGSGLGLYIVKTAVDGMGGTVAAASAVGQGTEITVTLVARPLENFP